MAVNNYYDYLADLIVATDYQQSLKKVSNIDPLRLRSLPWTSQMLKKRVVTEQGGMQYRWRLNTNAAPAPATFGPYQEFTYTQGEFLGYAQMGLGRLRTSWSFDELEEDMNMGKEQLVDLIKLRSQNAKIAMALAQEYAGWTFSADANAPQGVLYWFPYCTATGTTAAGTYNPFTGTVSTGTLVANVDPTTDPYTGFKSAGDTYTDVSDSDCLEKLRLLLSMTKFQPQITPLVVPDHNTGYDMGIYMGLFTQMKFERLLKLGNDNIGMDLDKYHGMPMFRHIPIIEVPALQTNTHQPIFGLNWGQISTRVLKDNMMRTIVAPRSSTQFLVVNTNIISVYQTVCENRAEAGFNLSLA